MCIRLINYETGEIIESSSAAPLFSALKYWKGNKFELELLELKGTSSAENETIATIEYKDISDLKKALIILNKSAAVQTDEIINEFAQWIAYCYIEGARDVAFNEYLNQQCDYLSEAFETSKRKLKRIVYKEPVYSAIKAATIDNISEWIGAAYLDEQEYKQMKELVSCIEIAAKKN